MSSDIEEEFDEKEEEESYLVHKSEYEPIGMPQRWLAGETAEWLTDLLIFNFMIDDEYFSMTDYHDAIPYLLTEQRLYPTNH